MYEARKKRSQIFIKQVPGRTVKGEQEEIYSNHLKAIFAAPVACTNDVGTV